MAVKIRELGWNNTSFALHLPKTFSWETLEVEHATESTKLHELIKIYQMHTNFYNDMVSRNYIVTTNLACLTSILDTVKQTYDLYYKVTTLKPHKVLVGEKKFEFSWFEKRETLLLNCKTLFS